MRNAALCIQTNFRGLLGRRALQYLQDEEERRRRFAAAWQIQCAARQRFARDRANHRRALRDGATKMQCTFRMYVVRLWFLKRRAAAIRSLAFGARSTSCACGR